MRKRMAGRLAATAIAAVATIAALATTPLAVGAGPRTRIERIRAADPDGGAPWGIRTFSDPNGGACAQEGRVVGGKLGTVDDRGTFTETPTSTDGCAVSDRLPLASYGFHLTYTNAPSACLANASACPPATQRTVFDGLFGSDLTRVVFADADGGHARRLAIGPRGDYLAVIRGGVTDATTPRVTLTFDSGCTRAGRARLGMLGARRHGCTVVVPDLFGPRPVPESAASKRARQNPSAPVHVSAEAQPNVHARVFFLARFRAPITAASGEGYAFRVRGPGHFPSCGGSLDETQSGPLLDYATMVRGRVTTLLVQPLAPSDHRRFCPGRFRVDAFFVSHGHAYAPFGHAFMDVPAVR